MARLVRRLLVGQIDPRGAGAQDEQNAVEHFTSAAPHAATAVFVSFRFWNQGVSRAHWASVRSRKLAILQWSIARALSCQLPSRRLTRPEASDRPNTDQGGRL